MCSCSQYSPVLLPHKPSGLPTCAPGRSQCLHQMPEKRCTDAMLGSGTRACIASGTLLPSFCPSLHTPLLLRIGTVLTRLQLPVGQHITLLVCSLRCCSCGVARTAVCSSCSAPALRPTSEYLRSASTSHNTQRLRTLSYQQVTSCHVAWSGKKRLQQQPMPQAGLSDSLYEGLLPSSSSRTLEVRIRHERGAAIPTRFTQSTLGNTLCSRWCWQSSQYVYQRRRSV